MILVYADALADHAHNMTDVSQDPVASACPAGFTDTDDTRSVCCLCTRSKSLDVTGTTELDDLLNLGADAPDGALDFEPSGPINADEASLINVSQASTALL